jgi:hypothetical protein
MYYFIRPLGMELTTTFFILHILFKNTAIEIGINFNIQG